MEGDPFRAIEASVVLRGPDQRDLMPRGAGLANV
jgi:hypothetical protein